MNRRAGRAHIFIRWSGFTNVPGRMGQVGWAFDFIDRLGRFVCFHCGTAGVAKETVRDGARHSATEKCSTLPDLIKTMPGGILTRYGTRVDDTVHRANSKIKHAFVQVMPHEVM